MLIQPDLGRPTPERASGPAKEMLSVIQDNGRTHVRINYSSLSILLTCMQKANFALHRGLRSKTESPAIVFGLGIHKALEVFYREPRESRTLLSNLGEHLDRLRADQELAEDPSEHFLLRAGRAFLREAAPLRVLPDSDKRSLSAGLWALTHYFKTYIDDPFVVYEDFQGPITERTCEALLHESGELKITFFGTIDVVLRNDRTGVILPTDHKTFSSAAGDFYKRLKPNHQYTGYVWLTREALGLDVDTFLVNGIQVKPRPVTARGTPPNFPRQPTRRTAEDISDFKKTVIWAVKQYLQASQDKLWPMGDVNACSMYNGCQFQTACEVPQAVRENVISANFSEGKDDAKTE